MLITAWFCSVLFACTAHCIEPYDTYQQSVLGGLEPGSLPILKFLSTWQILGPFQIGTREAIWGADPLERCGGFTGLPYDPSVTYPSSLAPNASVKWEERHFQTEFNGTTAEVDLIVGHDNIDWESQRSYYGWASNQYQTWIRGTLMNAGSSTIRVALYPKNVLELIINNERHFGGDFYGFERAPIVLDIPPGPACVEVRMIRDVRAHGGVGAPLIEASLSAIIVWNRAEILESETLVPDIVDDRFVSSFGSVTLVNLDDGWLTVTGISVQSAHSVQVTIPNIRIASGQSRSLRFCLNDLAFPLPSITITVRYSSDDNQPLFVRHSIQTIDRDRHDPQKFTFLHPSGSVSYAVLRPPSREIVQQANETLPILVALHGAGLEADSYQVRHSYDDILNLPAWLLLPTGMSPWSGDDWHTWGLADVESALRGILQWVEETNWSGPGADIDRFVVCGHSNGGQGTWHLAVHQPDRIIAAGAASAYTSIENYVPYVLWNNLDSLQEAILQSARKSYKHELFLSNLASTPVLIQHGQIDDNVPVHHGRLMKSLASRGGLHAVYVEVPDKGHWWDQAMVTDSFKKFYGDNLQLRSLQKTDLGHFICVFGNSHDFESCKGIAVDQLHNPDQLGRATVTITHTANGTTWSIETENMRRFHLDFTFAKAKVAQPQAISIDDERTLFELDDTDMTFFRGADQDRWVQEHSHSWHTLSERWGRQRGAMDAILRTRGPFQIVYDSATTLMTAVQISRNLVQYFGASADLENITEYEKALEEDGNVVLVCLGPTLPKGQLLGLPIDIREGNIHIRSGGQTRTYAFTTGQGGAWLRPLPNQKVELVVWGFDQTGLDQAMRMAPTLTGGGQPDFVLFSREAAWKGVAGVLAMGFFDHSWNVSRGSYWR